VISRSYSATWTDPTPSTGDEADHSSALRRYVLALCGALVLWIWSTTFDWMMATFVYPGTFTPYVWVRVLGGTMILLALYGCRRRPPMSRAAFETMDLALTVFISALMSVNALFGGGLESLYSIGIIQVMVFRALARPEHWRRGLPKLVICAFTYPVVLGGAALFSPAIQSQFGEPRILAAFAGILFGLSGTLGLMAFLAHSLWLSHAELAAQRRHLERYLGLERLGRV
jgi:hypothetical protein